MKRNRRYAKNRIPWVELFVALLLISKLLDLSSPWQSGSFAFGQHNGTGKRERVTADFGRKWREHAAEGDWTYYAKHALCKRYNECSEREWVALWRLWQWESGWRYTADNPHSSAYGIPQCMLSLHETCNAAFVTDPQYQIDWGLAYIEQRYGKPSIAWLKHQSRCGTSDGCWY